MALRQCDVDPKSPIATHRIPDTARVCQCRPDMSALTYLGKNRAGQHGFECQLCRAGRWYFETELIERVSMSISQYLPTVDESATHWCNKGAHAYSCVNGQCVKPRDTSCPQHGGPVSHFKTNK